MISNYVYGLSLLINPLFLKNGAIDTKYKKIKWILMNEAFVKDHKSSYKNEVRFQDNELRSIVCLDESELK